MNEHELGRILKEMYDNAPKGEKVAMIHIFGIKYANEIRDNNLIPKNILKSVHMPESYEVEINNGIKLAKYVSIK